MFLVSVVLDGFFKFLDWLAGRPIGADRRHIVQCPLFGCQVLVLPAERNLRWSIGGPSAPVMHICAVE